MRDAFRGLYRTITGAYATNGMMGFQVSEAWDPSRKIQKTKDQHEGCSPKILQMKFGRPSYRQYCFGIRFRPIIVRRLRHCAKE
jgi:hypothetical protein